MCALPGFTALQPAKVGTVFSFKHTMREDVVDHIGNAASPSVRVHALQIPNPNPRLR